MLVDQATYEAFKSGAYGNNEWDTIPIQKVATPSYEFINHIVNALNRPEYEDHLHITPIRLVDAPVMRHIRENSVADDAGHHADAKEMWPCPLAIQVRWKYEFEDLVVKPQLPVCEELTSHLIDYQTERLEWGRSFKYNPGKTQTCLTVNKMGSDIQLWGTHRIFQDMFDIRMRWNSSSGNMAWQFMRPSPFRDKIERRTFDRYRFKVFNWRNFNHNSSSERTIHDNHDHWHPYGSSSFTWTLGGLAGIQYHFKFERYADMHTFLKELQKADHSSFNYRQADNFETCKHGYTRVWKLFTENKHRLFNDHPVLFCLMRSMAQNSRSKIQNIRYTRFINKMLPKCRTYNDLVSELMVLWTDIGRTALINCALDKHCITKIAEVHPCLPILASEDVKRKSKTVMEKLCKSLKMDSKTLKRKYPTFHEAIRLNQIPKNVFYRRVSGVYNDNLLWWEKMLKLDPQTTIQIAKTISTSAQSSRNLMGYFKFVLYDLKRYLKKHTGKDWAVVPSTNPATHRTSSRYTGQIRVDNDARIVQVPFGLAPSTYEISSRASWTVCKDWRLVEKGSTFNGDVFPDTIYDSDGHKYGMLFTTATSSHSGKADKFLLQWLISFDNDNVSFHRVLTNTAGGRYKPNNLWFPEAIKHFTRGKTDHIRAGYLMFTPVEDMTFHTTASHIGIAKFVPPVQNLVRPYDRNVGDLGHIKTVVATSVRTPDGNITLDPGTYAVSVVRQYNSRCVDVGFWLDCEESATFDEMVSTSDDEDFGF
jgi:hypothetical protein